MTCEQHNWLNTPWGLKCTDCKVCVVQTIYEKEFIEGYGHTPAAAERDLFNKIDRKEREKHGT